MNAVWVFSILQISYNIAYRLQCYYMKMPMATSLIGPQQQGEGYLLKGTGCPTMR